MENTNSQNKLTFQRILKIKEFYYLLVTQNYTHKNVTVKHQGKHRSTNQVI